MRIGILGMSRGNRYQPESERTEYVTGGTLDDETAAWKETQRKVKVMHSLAEAARDFPEFREHLAESARLADDAVSPSHYKGFSNGAEVIDITENLTGNGAAAVKYLARACRLDGNNKGQVIEDLRKGLWYTQRELDRLGDDDA